MLYKSCYSRFCVLYLMRIEMMVLWLGVMNAAVLVKLPNELQSVLVKLPNELQF